MKYMEIRIEKERWEELMLMLSADSVLFTSFYQGFEIDSDVDSDGDPCTLLGWGDKCPDFKKFLAMANKGFLEVLLFLFDFGYDIHTFQVSLKALNERDDDDPVWDKSSFGKYNPVYNPLQD